MNGSVDDKRQNETGTDELGGVETWRVYCEAAKLEYEYAHIDSNKLDNKVYILLAVCAFLFPILHSVRIETADFMSSWPEFILAVIRFSPLICLSAAIILLLSVIKTVRISRVDVLNLLDNQRIDSESPLDVEKNFTLLYAASRDAGKEEQDRKYKVAYTALMFIIVSVLLFMTAVIQHEYKGNIKGGEVKMSMNYNAEISQEEVSKMTADELLEYAMKTGKLLRKLTTKDLMNSKYFTFLGVPKKN